MANTTSVKKRSYGVDVASYQSNAVKYSPAKFALVKVTEGTNYVNPKAKSQLSSAKKNGLLPMSYFFATFGCDAALAKSEAKYAVKESQALGVPTGSYIAVDWEAGEGNNISGGKKRSARAIIEAMDVIKQAGYQPLLYSGASLMRNNIDSSLVVDKFGTCLWVASYPKKGRTDTPAFGYFPSMDGVAIWQFTDNWKGFNVDGNITLIELKIHSKAKNSTKKKQKGTPLHVYVQWNVPRVFVVTNLNGAAVYDKSDLKNKKDTWAYGTGHRVYGESNGALDVGNNKWVDGRAGYTKSNPLAYLEYKSGRIIVMQDGTHALYAPKGDAKKAYAIKKGTILHVSGRSGRFFKLKDKYKNKDVWVTAGIDAKRSYVIL